MKPLFWLRLILLLIFCSAAASFLACQSKKRRAPHLAQGQGQNLDRMEQIDGALFELQTSDPLGPLEAQEKKERNLKITKSQSLRIDPNIEEFNTFPLVKYTTTAPLLGEIPFRGRPNFKYQIQYRLSDKYLKIYKIGKKADIPHQEWSYSEKHSESEIEVPLVAYKILSYYRIEVQRDANDKSTNLLMEIPESDAGRATHVRIDYHSRTLFEAALRVDVYPVSFFEGEWYFAKTIVFARDEKSQDIGRTSVTDGGLAPAPRIRFIRSNTFLRGINVNVDKRLENTNELNFDTVINLPVQWKNYRVAREGSDQGLKEEELTLEQPTQNPYIEIDFEHVINSDSTTPSKGSPNKSAEQPRPLEGDKRLVDLQFAKNYFSFTLMDVVSGHRIKYAFKKVDQRSFPQRTYQKEEHNRFGFFSVRRRTLNTYEEYRQEDRNREIFLSRFNPQQEIIYHFTQSSPKEERIRALGRAAISYWNSALAAGGAATRLRLDESFDVELGDLRYNSLNFIQSYTDNDSYGMGPILQDPFSGEIVQATANIHLTSLKANLIEATRNFIYDKAQRLDQPIVETLDSLWPITGLPASLKPPHRRNLFGKAIEARCSELMKYTETLKSSKRPSDQELSIIERCVVQISDPQVLHATVHELGHNLGLRHNFRGSTDQDNFFKDPNQIKSLYNLTVSELPRASSVMDYPDHLNVSLFYPGPYDIAALAFGYRDQTDQKKTYQYCSDEDLQLNLNPFCARNDEGTTATEIVSHTILNFLDHLKYRQARIDRIKQATDAQLFQEERLSQFYLPLKRFYDEWRFQLNNNPNHQLGPFLSGIGVSDYNNFLQKQADSGSSSRLRDLKEARDLIFNFFTKSLLYFPNRYCLATDQDNQWHAVEFEMLKTSFRNSVASLSSCQDPTVLKYLSSQGMTLQREIGIPIMDLRFPAKDILLTDPIDIAGFLNHRLNAAVLLTQRTDQGYARTQPFIPAFLDEPDLRERWGQMIMERLIEGVDLSAFLPSASDNDSNQRSNASENHFLLPHFQAESGIITRSTEFFFREMAHPMGPLGNDAMNWQQPYTVTLLTQSQLNSLISEAEIFFLLPNNRFACANRSNSQAQKIIFKLRALNAKINYQFQSGQKIDPKAVRSVLEPLLALWPTTPLNSLSVKEVVDWVEKNISPISEKATRLMLDDFFSPEMALYDRYVKLNAAGASYQMSLKEFLGQKLSEISWWPTEELASSMPPPSEALGLRLARFLKELELKEGDWQNRNRPNELKAQLNILTNLVVSTLSRPGEAISQTK